MVEHLFSIGRSHRLLSLLSSIDLLDDPASQYTLGTLEAETLCDLIFKAGDEGGSFIDPSSLIFTHPMHLPPHCISVHSLISTPKRTIYISDSPSQPGRHIIAKIQAVTQRAMSMEASNPQLIWERQTYEQACEAKIQSDLRRYVWEGTSPSIPPSFAVTMAHTLNLLDSEKPGFVHQHAARTILEMQANGDNGMMGGGGAFGSNTMMKPRFDEDTMRARIECELHNERMQAQQQKQPQTTQSKLHDMSQEIARTREELHQERVMRDNLGQSMFADNSNSNNFNQNDNFFANHGMALTHYLPTPADGTKMRPSFVSQESVTILTLMEPVGLAIDPKCVTFETMPGIIYPSQLHPVLT